MKSVFKETAGYTIEKTNDYYVAKFRTNLSEWKIRGQVNLFNIHQAIRDLINRMTANLPANVKIQIGLITPLKGDATVSTKLLTKFQMNDIISEWVNYFMDYKELNIEDITFRLMAIEIPSGSGKRANKVIDVSNQPLYNSNQKQRYFMYGKIHNCCNASQQNYRMCSKENLQKMK